MKDSADNTLSALLRQAVAHVDRNDAEKAEDLLSRVLARSPRDANALQLMGAVRRLQGRMADAESCYRRAVVHHPALPQAHHNLGNVLAEQGNHGAAMQEQREAIRLKPNFAQAHLGLATSLSAMGDHAAAVESCRQALRLQPNFLSAKMTLAVALNELNRPGESERILRQLLALGISDPRTVAIIEHNLAVALKRQGRLDEALVHLASARNRSPGIAAVDDSMGDTLERLGRLAEAFEAFRRAVAIEPDNADVLSRLALTAARIGNFEAARTHAARALARDPRNGPAHVALAMADMETGDFAAAETRLRLVLDDADLSRESRSNFALGLAADALDGHGRSPLAFAVYAGANERRRPAEPPAGSVRAIDDVIRLTRYFEHAPRWSPSPPSPGSASAAGHVFLLGFMRSGTTLLTSALARHAEVVASDEREYLTGPAGAFLLDDAGLDRLATLDTAEADHWRQAYWNAVRAAGFAVAGKIFVDKMPFNILRLPLIARLFPDAKILLARRDPRDVVFSCFRRRFDMTPYSFEFLRLEDCARFHASVMALAELYRERLPLDPAIFRYEDMVADCESSMRAICGFVGIEWQDAMLDFAAASGAIDPKSVSAAQVRRGLYKDGVGQWRRYREQLVPVLPLLRPWIARMGYPPD